MISKNKDLSIIIIGKLLQAMIAIISIRITTSLFSPEQMGNIYIFTTIVGFFVLFFISPIGQYFNRNTHKWHEDNTLLNHLGIHFLYIVLISMLSVFIGYFLYMFGVSNGIDMIYFLPLLAGFVLILTLNQTVIPLLNMLHYRLSFTILTVLTTVCILLSGYSLVMIFEAKSEYWLAGIVFSNLLFLLIGFIVLQNRLNENFQGFKASLNKLTKRNIFNLMKFAIPLAAATLFMWLQNSSYRIVLEREIGLEFLGFLGVGMAVSSQIATMVEAIVMQYFSPIYYKKITKADKNVRKDAITDLINTVLPIYFMLAIFISFLAKYLTEILVHEKYHDVYVFTIFGIWIEFFRMSTNIFGNISQSEMNTKTFMIPYIIGGSVTLIGVYFATTQMSYKIIVPYALVFGGFITMLVMFFAMRKLLYFSIDKKPILYIIMLSLPYMLVLVSYNDIEHSQIYKYVTIGVFGIYFLGTIFFLYKKGIFKI